MCILGFGVEFVVFVVETLGLTALMAVELDFLL
jgi:hypothetical protein